jgi:lipoprotein-anchoring transpeptidase ErfK/SrfK
VYARPARSTRAVTTLPTLTGDGTQNIVLVLGKVVLGLNQAWYHIRLAILPNDSTGWVPKDALGRLYAVHTHLFVDLKATTATLERNGVAVFKTIIGVGYSYWPTPRGQFYVRDKLTGFHNPFYGPIAFGTSARSPVLTDWPGGGYIGIHGTDHPQLLPGRVSHGCIRMPNASILALARLMGVGTPVTIS